MRQQVMHSLQGNVATWQHALQARWGDPRVYEAQRTERLKQDAALAYDLSRRNEVLLQDAYSARAAKHRDAHEKRIGDLKRRNYRAQGKRPGSQAETATRTPQQPPMPDPTQRQFPGPADYSAWPN